MRLFLLNHSSGVPGVVTFAIALDAGNQKAWTQLGMGHL